jgi:hypothetical protein
MEKKRMKISELKVLSVERDSYVPKGQREGDMVASCMDGSSKPVKMFFNVHLSGDDLAKHGTKIVGKVIEVENMTADSRLNIPFAGAPLKVSGFQIVKVA